MDSLASSSHKSEAKNSKPLNSLMNFTLPWKLSALMNDESAEKVASLFLIFFSLQNFSIKFMAPDLAANSCTGRLLEHALAII